MHILGATTHGMYLAKFILRLHAMHSLRLIGPISNPGACDLMELHMKASKACIGSWAWLRMLVNCCYRKLYHIHQDDVSAD